MFLSPSDVLFYHSHVLLHVLIWFVFISFISLFSLLLMPFLVVLNTTRKYSFHDFYFIRYAFVTKFYFHRSISLSRNDDKLIDLKDFIWADNPHPGIFIVWRMWSGKSSLSFFAVFYLESLFDNDGYCSTRIWAISLNFSH